MSRQDVLENSFQACFGTLNTDVSFVNDFYLRLKGRDHKIKAIFDRIPVENQLHALRSACYTLLDCFKDGEVSSELERFGRLHSHVKMGMEPYMYDVWLETLIETVAEHDPNFGANTALAWREAMKPGIDILKRSLCEPARPVE